MQGRVVAGHTTAMGSYNDAYAFKLLQILKRAGRDDRRQPARQHRPAGPVRHVSEAARDDPGQGARRRRHQRRLRPRLDHGPWYPLGRGSMLDALSMLVHVAQMTGRAELFRAYEMVTTNPARAAEVEYGVKEGLPANFVVFDCADEAEAIRLRPAARWVVRQGPDRGRDGAGAERGPPRRARPTRSRSPRDREGEGAPRGLERRRPRRTGKGARTGTWRPIRYASRGCPRARATCRSKRHGMEPIPRAARYGSVNRVFTVWFTPESRPGGVLHRDARRRRFHRPRLVDRARGDHRRQRDRCGPRRPTCQRWARRPGWPRSRPAGCHSASRSSFRPSSTG